MSIGQSEFLAGRIPSANRTASKLKSDSRTSASRMDAKSKADYRGRAKPGQKSDPVAKVSELPSCAFGPNCVGGDCFFPCIEGDTGNSAHSQRAILPLAMATGDLALYREWME